MSEKIKDRIATYFLYTISVFVVSLLLVFLGYIIIRGSGSFNFHFLFGESKNVEAGSGIGTQLFNSFYLLIVTLLITVPLGVGAGIYLAEYAKPGKLLNLIRLCIETIASLPSIVVGLFALIFFVRVAGFGYSLIAGAFAVSIINIPSMTRVSENAIRAIPTNVKEASLALGATKWQTIRNVLLPLAMPQILTGIILSSGRIFGEAAALIYSAGMSAPKLRFDHLSLTDKLSPFALTRSAETLAVYIWKVNSEGMLPDATKVANGASAVLVIMVLAFNFAARIIGRKIHEAYTGKSK